MLNPMRLTLEDLDLSSFDGTKKHPTNKGNVGYAVRDDRYRRNVSAATFDHVGGMVAMADEGSYPQDETELLSDFGARRESLAMTAMLTSISLLQICSLFRGRERHESKRAGRQA